MTVSNKSKRMKRSTAERLLRELIGRVESIQDDDSLAYMVSDLVLFGSYLSDREDLGDLDVAVNIVRRFEGDEQLRVEEERRKATCPGSADFVLRLFWPNEEIYRMIRNRSAWIQLISVERDGEVIFSGPHRYIWKDGERVWYPDSR